MSPSNNTFCPATASLHLASINENMNVIQAIAMAGSSMFDERSSEAVLFKHIYDLAGDAESYYALKEMFDSASAMKEESAV